MQPKRDIQQNSSSSLIRKKKKKYTKSSHHIACSAWSLKFNISQSCCSLEVCLSSSRISRRQQWIIALFTQQHLSLSLSLFPLLLLLPSHLLVKLIYQFSKVIVKPARVTPIEHFLSFLLASQWRPPSAIEALVRRSLLFTRGLFHCRNRDEHSTDLLNIGTCQFPSGL